MSGYLGKAVLASVVVAMLQYSATASAEWTKSQSVDKMRNMTTTYASVKSENKAQFDFPYEGGAVARIALIKRQGEATEVALTITKGQFSCFMGCELSAKFDDGRIEKFRGVSTANGTTDAIFIEPESRFISRVKSAKRLIIEAPFFQEPRTQFEFIVTGLSWDSK